MQRKKKTFPLCGDEFRLMKEKMLSWAQQFSIFLFLDSHAYTTPYGRYECLLGADIHRRVPDNDTIPLEAIYQWHAKHKDWIFGHLSYDFKNHLEPSLSSNLPATQHFPDIFFFCPKIVCSIPTDKKSITIETLGEDPEMIYQSILQIHIQENIPPLPKLSFNLSVEASQYLQNIASLKEHIRNGDCYEINYCCESSVIAPHIDPIHLYRHLSLLSPAPFGGCYRIHEQWMLGASPERFIQKDKNIIRSQPIKGTRRRGNTTEQDQQLITELRNSIKDKAENVMITDLVRNDLAASCTPGSIEVAELFGIYTFPQVHQMISTVEGKLRPETPFTEVIRYTFPAGSMTGAPKIKVMQLTEQYEKRKRGLYAGSIGYISPGADFDFNVVIRSLFYHTETATLSYWTGGAITYDSDPMGEWEEMRLKAWALERIFAGSYI